MTFNGKVVFLEPLLGPALTLASGTSHLPALRARGQRMPSAEAEGGGSAEPSGNTAPSVPVSSSVEDVGKVKLPSPTKTAKKAAKGGPAGGFGRVPSSAVSRTRSTVSRRAVSNLESFDHDVHPIFSPRSAKALSNLGLFPEDMVRKPPSAFGDKDTLPDVLHMRADHFEKRRMHLLEEALAEYHAMLKKQAEEQKKQERRLRRNDDVQSVRSLRSIGSSLDNRSLEERAAEAARKEAEVLKKKQREEVESIILAELCDQKLKEADEEKKEEIRRKQAEEVAEKKRREKQAAKERAERERHKWEEEQRAEARRKQIVEEEMRKEREQEPPVPKRALPVCPAARARPPPHPARRVFERERRGGGAQARRAEREERRRREEAAKREVERLRKAQELKVSRRPVPAPSLQCNR
jgi:hypothetical protein